MERTMRKSGASRKKVKLHFHLLELLDSILMKQFTVIFHFLIASFASILCLRSLFLTQEPVRPAGGETGRELHRQRPAEAR